MADVTFLPEKEAPPVDQKLEQIASECMASSKKIRLRVQPDFYLYPTRQYTRWSGLAWTVDLEDLDEGRRLREGLERFFRLFGKEQTLLLESLEQLDAAQAGRD